MDEPCFPNEVLALANLVGGTIGQFCLDWFPGFLIARRVEFYLSYTLLELVAVDLVGGGARLDLSQVLSITEIIDTLRLTVTYGIKNE